MFELTNVEKNLLSKHFVELKAEMSIDAKHLTEQSQINTLQTTKTILEKKLRKTLEENNALTETLNETKKTLENLNLEMEEIENDIKRFIEEEKNVENKEILEKIQSMVAKNEELRQFETSFKEKCRQEAAKLQQEIA